jgi:tricorn protease
MKTTLFSLLLSITSFSLLAQVTPEWMRYPSVSPEGTTIAFVYQGDIYTVGVEGGQAQRLTFQPEMDVQPVWSPDGQTIAFASERHGNFDVYVMDAKGGEATRLSYHSNNEMPLSFSADGQLIYFDAHRLDNSANREYPTSSHTELYSVPAQGGGISQVFSLPVKALSERDNRGFLYEDMPGREDAWRKHHQSAVTHDIWLYNRSESSHTKLTDFVGEDRNPVWNGDGTAFYFLSERSGTFNVS